MGGAGRRDGGEVQRQTRTGQVWMANSLLRKKKKKKKERSLGKKNQPWRARTKSPNEWMERMGPQLWVSNCDSPTV